MTAALGAGGCHAGASSPPAAAATSSPAAGTSSADPLAGVDAQLDAMERGLDADAGAGS